MQGRGSIQTPMQRVKVMKTSLLSPTTSMGGDRVRSRPYRRTYHTIPTYKFELCPKVIYVV